MNLSESAPHCLIRIVLLAMALYTAGACADDLDASMFSFSGFGTIGEVHSSENKADFTSTIFKPDGAGYRRTWSADVDSLFAAQITANFTSQLSAIVQIISEQNYDNTYRPHVEWANIKYQFTPDFSVRLGRTVLPAFLLSDTRKVGYTYPWVRPPLEVYYLLPLSSSDGLDFSYRLHFGELMNTAQINVGKKDFNLVDTGGIAKARSLMGISDTTEYGPLTIRIAYQKSYLTIASFNALFDAFRSFGQQGIAIADKYDSNDKPYSFLGVGASYDPGNWFVMSELGYVSTHSLIGKNTSWYASGGYRFGKITPYVTYARARSDNLSDPGLTISALLPFEAGSAADLNAALNSLLSTKVVQNTVSVGGRWDFMRNTDLKLQFDHTRIGAGSTGVLIDPQPGFRLGITFNVFSTTIDVVF